MRMLRAHSLLMRPRSPSSWDSGSCAVVKSRSGTVLWFIPAGNPTALCGHESCSAIQIGKSRWRSRPSSPSPNRITDVKRKLGKRMEGNRNGNLKQLLPILGKRLYICRKSDGSTLVLFRLWKHFPSVTYVECFRFGGGCSFFPLLGAVGNPTDAPGNREDG